MKIKAGYEIKKVSDRYIVIPKASANLDFNGIITINNSGRLLFMALQKKSSVDSLVKVLTDEFEVENKQAKTDVLTFIKTLKKHDLLEVWIK